MSHGQNNNREANHETDHASKRDATCDPTPNIGHKHDFVKKVASALRKQCRVLPGQMILAAVSGGGDSVALLHALSDLAPRKYRKQTPWFHLAVGHVQHHLRDDAEEDAKFVEQLARQHNLPFFRDDIKISNVGNLENNARKARYLSLATLAKQAGAQIIATAHHGDDQLETILMRILRGTSVQGLRSIAWRRKLKLPRSDSTQNPNDPIALIRPMLNLDHQAALELLGDIDQPWREDHSNTDLTRTRARLRNEVLPVLRCIQPAAAIKATQLADDAKDIAQALDAAQQNALKQIQIPNEFASDLITLNRPAARKLARAILCSVLRCQFIAFGANADHLPHRTLLAIDQAIRDQTGGVRTFDVKDLRLNVTKKTVTITKNQKD